jgi:flavin reductase (DIM6/NTAB) family NADH-FMN oxidoreductase RutF
MNEAPTISIVPSSLPPRDAYRIMTGLIVPRPIAWVSTVGADGSSNLAPFSFFNGVAGNPPTLMISIGQRNSAPKDTLRNIQETGEFVVNLVSSGLVEAMNITAGEYEYEVDEFALAGITKCASVDVRPPRVADALAAMECRLLTLIPIEGSTYTMVLGRIVRYHLRKDLVRADGSVDPARLQPVGRLSGDEYALLGESFMMKRP